MERLELIIGILGGIIASIGVIWPVVRQLIKEIKDVKQKWDEAYADGNLSDDELVDIGKEAIEAIAEALKLWNLIKKTFRKK